MRRLFQAIAVSAVLPMMFALTAQAQGVISMYGGVVIDGYNIGKDSGPRGSIIFDKNKKEFRGFYYGLKMPKGRKAIFAWVHNTKNGKSTYLGPVGWLKAQPTNRNSKGNFKVKVPREFSGGNFGDNEIIAFSSEKTGYIRYEKGKPVAATKPRRPSGSSMMKYPNPAFFLFAKLPGADTELHYCGHGKDFFYAKEPTKQTCYD